MIEDPIFIRKREFRTPLAAQWWRFFNFLGIRCPALRSVETGKWWSEVDFYLPTLKVAVLVADRDADADLGPTRGWGSPVLTLGPVPDPEAAGEWCWQLADPDGLGLPKYFSFHDITTTGRLHTDHNLPGGATIALTAPILDGSIEPDIEVQRGLWVARTGAANRTGSRRLFGPDGVRIGPEPIPTVASEPVPLVALPPVQPNPADFPLDGQRVLVYQHFDADGMLLYIGISDQPTRRGKVHAAYSGWVEFAVDMNGKWCNSRAHAEALEEYLIRTRHPIFNTRHNDGPEARERHRVYLAAKGRLDLLDAA